MTQYDHLPARGGHRRGLGRAVVTGLLSALVAAAVVLWAWNGAGAALFSLPEAKFAQIAAIVIALAALASLVRAVLFGDHGRRNR